MKIFILFRILAFFSSLTFLFIRIFFVETLNRGFRGTDFLLEIFIGQVLVVLFYEAIWVVRLP